MAGDRPKVFASAKLAWSDLFRVIADMPVLALGTVALGLVFGMVDIVLVHWTGRVPSTLGALAASSVVRALWAFFLTPVYLAVHRYIILGEVTSAYALAIEQPRFQRFFLCTLVLYAIWLLPSVPGLFGHSGVAIAAMVIVTLVCTFVSTRLIILFPAIAVDAPGTSFRNAFDDTKGYFWRIFGILIVATLPIIVASIAIALWLSPLSAASKLMSAVMNMPTMALGIAIASRLYLGLSDRLGQPGAGAVEIGTA